MTEIEATSRPQADAAPPTEPGEMGRPKARTTSPWAVWSLVCAVVGLVIAPFALAAIGLGVVGLRRLAAPNSKHGGRGVALAGIWTGAGGLLLVPLYGMLGWGIYTAITGAGRMEALQDLQLLHLEAVSFSKTTGRYPVHPAELLVDSNGSFDAHRRVRNHGRTRGPDVTLGRYDFDDYDGSTRSLDAVVAALEAIDESEPIYRFGDCWFVRLDRPRDNADLVFAWWPDPDGGPVQVIMDDGSVHAVTRFEWETRWGRDAVARSDAGLAPLVEPPPYP